MVKERERPRKPAAAYMRAAKRIAQEVGSPADDVFSPAEETDLESLGQLGMPHSVIDFYRDFAPIETIELHELRLWDVAHLLEENHHYSPGAEIHELGYVVIAGIARATCIAWIWASGATRIRRPSCTCRIASRSTRATETTWTSRRARWRTASTSS